FHFQFCGDGVHHPLHRVDPLGAPGAAVGGDDDGVRVQALEDYPVVGDLVGPEELGGGDDRDDETVGDVRPVVVPELEVDPLYPTLVVKAHLDALLLAAFVGGGDEVFAAVLDEFHRPAQGAGGE